MKTILRAAMGATLLLFAIPTGFATTRTYDIPFDEAATALYTALHLDPVETTTKPERVQAKAEGPLATHMHMKLYAVELDEFKPGNTLSFTCSHDYNIGASGAESIRFHIQKETRDQTTITVDYCDRWYGMWPPFVFWNPGLLRESKIHNQIWKP